MIRYRKRRVGFGLGAVAYTLYTGQIEQRPYLACCNAHDNSRCQLHPCKAGRGARRHVMELASRGEHPGGQAQRTRHNTSALSVPFKSALMLSCGWLPPSLRVCTLCNKYQYQQLTPLPEIHHSPLSAPPRTARQVLHRPSHAHCMPHLHQVEPRIPQNSAEH